MTKAEFAQNVEVLYNSLNAAEEEARTHEEEEQNNRFAKLWQAYPRKEGRYEAKLLFDKMRPNKESFAEIMQGVEYYKKEIWHSTETRYIPFLKNFLYRRLWTDVEDWKKQEEKEKNRQPRMGW